MSINCGTRHEPNLSNVCTLDQIGNGDTLNYRLPNFCTGTVGFDDIREEFCQRIGGGNEWDFDHSTTPGDCYLLFGDRNDGISIDELGCCHFDCAVPGMGTTCKRIAYNGNPNDCCFRDLSYNSLEIYCYDNNNRTNTCPPQYRSIVGDSCQTLLSPFCSGDDLDLSNPTQLETLKERWLGSSGSPSSSLPRCQYYLNRLMFNNPNVAGLMSGNPINSSLFVNRQGFQAASQVMNRLIANYTEAGYQIGAIPGFPGYDSEDFQSSIIFPICSTIPGLCEASLENVCGAVTTDQLTSQPSLVPWCGCYMNNSQYEHYVDNFQINKECTPVCARQGNIPLANNSGYGVTLCEQSVCLIDNVTIALESTQIGGDINFAQFCGSCSNSTITGTSSSNNDFNTNVSTCQCIIDGLSLTAANSAIGGNVNLSESCGPSSICYQKNPNGNDPPNIQVPCDAGPHYNPNDDPAVIARREAEEAARQRRIIMVTLVIIFLIIIVVILFMFR